MARGLKMIENPSILLTFSAFTCPLSKLSSQEPTKGGDLHPAVDDDDDDADKDLRRCGRSEGVLGTDST